MYQPNNQRVGMSMWMAPADFGNGLPMPDTEFSVCIECRHHKGPGREGIWYDHYCGHPDVENSTMRDPVTGVVGFGGRNDLGRTFVCDQRHPHARDINSDGDCKRWECNA